MRSGHTPPRRPRGRCCPCGSWPRLLAASTASAGSSHAFMGTEVQNCGRSGTRSLDPVTLARHPGPGPWLLAPSRVWSLS